MDNLKFSSTLELMNAVASVLTGEPDIEVLIAEPSLPPDPSGGRALAETYRDISGALKIAISPDATIDGEQELNVFLHECAHARMHAEWLSDGDNNDARKRNGIEIEARAVANAWKIYANKNAYAMESFQQRARGYPSDSPVADITRKLLALMAINDDANERMVESQRNEIGTLYD